MGLCRRRGSFRVHHPVGVPHMGEGSWAALPSRLGSPGSCGEAFGFLTAACARNHRAKLQVRCGGPGRARCQRGLKQPPSPRLLGNREHPQPHVPQGGQGSIQKHSLSPCTHFLLQAPGDARRGGGGREQGAELCFPSRIVFQTPLLQSVLLSRQDVSRAGSHPGDRSRHLLLHAPQEGFLGRQWNKNEWSEME